MPTGYTADLMEKGQDFKTFVMRCSRAMGALIMMRDDPMDAPIPKKFEPSDYHIKALVEARETHDRLTAMSNEEKIAFGKEEKEKAIKRHQGWLERDRIQNDRLAEMQSQVMAWRPPTPDHEGFKKFMLDQIKISMNDTEYIARQITEAEEKSPMDFYVAALSSAAWNINYHKKGNTDEIDRAEKRTEWVNQLRKSIG